MALSILPALQTVVLIADNHEDYNTLNKYSIKDYREFATRYKAEYYMFCEREGVGTSRRVTPHKTYLPITTCAMAAMRCSQDV
jgi:hypothetical protein